MVYDVGVSDQKFRRQLGFVAPFMGAAHEAGDFDRRWSGNIGHVDYVLHQLARR